jgi:hypothetical protein
MSNEALKHHGNHESEAIHESHVRAVERLSAALRGLRFGVVTAVVHDGVVVSIERTEKLRLANGTDRA